RHFALTNAGGELDIDFAAVVIGIHRPPGRLVTLDDVAVAALTHLRDERCERQSFRATTSVFGVESGDRRHIELFTGAKFDQVGPPIGIDYKICFDAGPRRLHHDVDAPGIVITALSVADDPANGVAGG